MGKVKIGKKVDYGTLEKALIKAAEELGWKAQVEDKFDKNYKLGSVQEIQEYNHTMVHLRGRLFSAMKVYIPHKEPSNHFFVLQGSPYGMASEKRVKEYLSAVSRNL